MDAMWQPTHSDEHAVPALPAPQSTAAHARWPVYADAGAWPLCPHTDNRAAARIEKKRGMLSRQRLIRQAQAEAASPPWAEPEKVKMHSGKQHRRREV